MFGWNSRINRYSSFHYFCPLSFLLCYHTFIISQFFSKCNTFYLWQIIFSNILIHNLGNFSFMIHMPYHCKSHDNFFIMPHDKIHILSFSQKNHLQTLQQDFICPWQPRTVFPALISRQNFSPILFKKHIRVTAHYTAHIGIAPSFQTDRKTRKYHYQRYASLPHATAALFARHSSLTALTSIPDFSIPSYALPHKNGSRQFLACPHSGSAHPTRPVCIYIFNYQGTHANLRWRAENPLPVLDKIYSGLASPKST